MWQSCAHARIDGRACEWWKKTLRQLCYEDSITAGPSALARGWVFRAKKQSRVRPRCRAKSEFRPRCRAKSEFRPRAVQARQAGGFYAGQVARLGKLETCLRSPDTPPLRHLRHLRHSRLVSKVQTRLRQLRHLRHLRLVSKSRHPPETLETLETQMQLCQVSQQLSSAPSPGSVSRVRVAQLSQV